jgi:hypothetical protein
MTALVRSVRYFTPLIPSLNVALVSMAAAAVIALGVHQVSIAHERQALRQAACAAKVSEHIARSPLPRAGFALLPADRCLALSILEGKNGRR